GLMLARWSSSFCSRSTKAACCCGAWWDWRGGRSHHALGRHSVASQAVTSGHSIKAVQAQLGHRSEQSTHVYAHLGSRAQLRLVEGLQPAAAPHGTLRAPSKKKDT
ncbi:MAG: tyrosine-type recombinase/integrase, partial [Deltaproteobacteria bacterium]|nr:tyrosine-type recombinase/integrase [Deltaproteobacteria bacterium]